MDQWSLGPDYQSCIKGSDDKFTNGILVGLPQNGKYFLHNHVTLEREGLRRWLKLEFDFEIGFTSTLWLFNIAMENHIFFFIGKPSIKSFSMAMLNNQMVYFNAWFFERPFNVLWKSFAGRKAITSKC